MGKKVCFISDTHVRHKSLNLGSGDILFFTGDIMGSGYDEYEFHNWLKWFSETDYKWKVFIAGNHDRYLEKCGYEKVSEIVKEYEDKGVIYLENTSVEIDGLKIYGTPDQPYFCGWAFNRTPDELRSIYNNIPEGLDVLLTHTPPFDILDRSHEPNRFNPTGEEPLGSRVLTMRLNTMGNPPRYHAFGHIHGDGGKILVTPQTTYINGAVCNEAYNPINDIVFLEID